MVACKLNHSYLPTLPFTGGGGGHAPMVSTTLQPGGSAEVPVCSHNPGRSTDLYEGDAVNRLQQFAVDEVDADCAGCSRLFSRLAAVAVLPASGQQPRRPRDRPQRREPGQLRLRAVVVHRRRPADIHLLYSLKRVTQIYLRNDCVPL